MNQMMNQEHRSEKNEVFFKRKQLFYTKLLWKLKQINYGKNPC